MLHIPSPPKLGWSKKFFSTLTKYIYIYVYIYVYIDVYIGIYRFIGRFNCRQGHVFMVRTKPSKQPLGLVTCGVPIEKVWPKALRPSDWACEATGALKGRLGRFNFRQGHVLMVQTKPSKQPLGLVVHGVPIEKGGCRLIKGPKVQAHGATGAPKGHLGKLNFRQGHVSMV